ncbi:MAG TPA: F0F1 ATP synthase subunit B [Pirellulales bacterium]|nr:F0F1 ATP synthase subunit B [Pirellulales bacterium]
MDAPAAKDASSAEAARAASPEARAGAEHEGHFGAPATVQGPEEFKSDLAIYTFIVFLLLLAILWKFAWGPIVAGLEKREQGIAENIAAAQRAHEEAKLLLADYERKLAGAADQIRVMMEEARKEAEKTKVQIIAEAKEAAKLEFDRSKRELQRATDQALKELSERATNLAVDLAGKIVRAQLSHADHARLVQEAMSEFVASGPSVN